MTDDHVHPDHIPRADCLGKVDDYGAILPVEDVESGEVSVYSVIPEEQLHVVEYLLAEPSLLLPAQLHVME